MKHNLTQQAEGAPGPESESPHFVTKQVFSDRMAWSLRTTDNLLKLRKIPYCKLGKMVRIPWPEARDHLLRNYQLNARGQ